MRVRIVIDDQEAECAPEAPFTLMVFKDNDVVELGNGDDHLIGDDMQEMLHTLIEVWPTSRFREIPEHASCDKCGREDRPLTYIGDEMYLCDRHIR